MSKINQELSRIQKELKAPKNQYNSFGKYKYRSAEDIVDSVKQVMGDCSLVITDEIQLIGDRYYVKATATLMLDGEIVFVSAYAREPEHRKGMDESQITGATSSYARKYALNGLFAIDDTRDPDATNDHKDDLMEKYNALPKDILDKLNTYTKNGRKFTDKQKAIRCRDFGWDLDKIRINIGLKEDDAPDTFVEDLAKDTMD